MNDTYCVRIFKGIYLEKAANGKARVSACCINKLSDPVDDVNFYTHPQLVSQRERIKNGEQIPECSRCWERERNGFSSTRTDNNQFYDHKNKDPYEVELVVADYNVPPLCNAMCIICSADYSSAWAAEDAKFNSLTTNRLFTEIYKSTKHKDLDLSALRRIYFNGGEPLLSNEHAEVLECIKEQQGSLREVDVLFNTNGSVLPSDRVISLWQETRSVTAMISVDAVGSQFEYIRYPLNWAVVEDNIRTFAKNATLYNIYGISISCAVGVHNVLELPEFFAWLKQIQAECPIIKSLDLQPVMGTLGLTNLSSELKHLYLQTLPNTDEYNLIRSWVEQAEISESQDWINYLNRLDKRRGLNWRETLKVGKVTKN